jgi:hypothetical protein
MLKTLVLSRDNPECGYTAYTGDSIHDALETMYAEVEAGHTACVYNTETEQFIALA